MTYANKVGKYGYMHYSNKYARMEPLTNGMWIVFNDVTGLPVYVDDVIKEFTWSEALVELSGIYNYYYNIEGRAA